MSLANTVPDNTIRKELIWVTLTKILGYRYVHTHNVLCVGHQHSLMIIISLNVNERLYKFKMKCN